MKKLTLYLSIIIYTADKLSPMYLCLE